MAMYKPKISKSKKYNSGKDLIWFLLRVGKNTLNTLFMDNKIIDGWTEKVKSLKDSDSECKQFFIELQKSYPKMTARLKLWMLYVLIAGMTVGGVKINQRNFHDKDDEKELVSNDECLNSNFLEFKKNMEPITPWLIAQIISAEGVCLDENGLHKPYKDGKGIWTIGYGSTHLKNGKPVTENTPHMTNEEAYELARWHIEEKETFFVLYSYCVNDNKLLPRSTGEAFGLCSIIYNSSMKFIEDTSDYNCKERFALLRKKYKEYGDNISDDMVLKIFRQYPIRKKQGFGRAWIDSHNPQVMAQAIGGYMKDGPGMHWRRWLEAGLITGDIASEVFFDCPIKGMTDFYLYMGGYKEYKSKGNETKEQIEQKNMDLKKSSLWEKTENGLIPKKSTYQDFTQWLSNPKTRTKITGEEDFITNRKKVKDFLPTYILQQCMDGNCEIGNFHKSYKHKAVMFSDGMNKIKNMKNQNNNQMFSESRNLS